MATYDQNTLNRDIVYESVILLRHMETELRNQFFQSKRWSTSRLSAKVILMGQMYKTGMNAAMRTTLVNGVLAVEDQFEKTRHWLEKLNDKHHRQPLDVMDLLDPEHGY